MRDRYDPRSDDGRDRGDRTFGSRGGTSERDRNDERDPRDVFTRDVDLPRGRERRPVRDRNRVYEINGTESRMLGTIGAFRVVSESDLHDLRDDSDSPRRSTRHLEREGLIRTSPLSSDDCAVVLTERGRDLLEANRYERSERAQERHQTFWAGLRKPRELTHDTKVYRAYHRAEERLRGQGGSVRRVVLDYELKRDYQRFLHERNRGKKDCDGRPDRTAHPPQVEHPTRSCCRSPPSGPRSTAPHITRLNRLAQSVSLPGQLAIARGIALRGCRRGHQPKHRGIAGDREDSTASL